MADRHHGFQPASRKSVPVSHHRLFWRYGGSMADWNVSQCPAGQFHVGCGNIPTARRWAAHHTLRPWRALPLTMLYPAHGNCRSEALYVCKRLFAGQRCTLGFLWVAEKRDVLWVSWESISLRQFISLLYSYLHWYNRERIKESLGWLSPLDFRRSLGLTRWRFFSIGFDPVFCPYPLVTKQPWKNMVRKPYEQMILTVK